MKEGMPEFPTLRRSRLAKPHQQAVVPNTYTTDSFGENVLPKAEGEAVSKEKERRPKPTPPIAPTL